MTAAPQPTTVSNALRSHWSSIVLATCLRHAGLLRIIDWPESGNTDLGQLPAAIHQVVFARCQEMIESACKTELQGRKRAVIERRVNGELWDFLKAWRRDELAKKAAS